MDVNWTLQSGAEPSVHFGLRILQDCTISPDSPIRSICPMAESISEDRLEIDGDGARFRIGSVGECGSD